MASAARGRRRAPKRHRRRTSPVRFLVIALTSLLCVVGTGVAIGWGSHVFAQHRDSHPQPDALAPDTTPAGQATSDAAKGADASSGAPSQVPSGKGSASKPPAPSAAGPGTTVTPGPIPKATGPGTLSTVDVPSADNDLKSRPVVIYKPAVPTGTVLPVVYLLHGVPGEPDTMMNAVKASLDQAFTTGGLAPFEVAAPTGGGNAHNDTEWADAVDKQDMVETYLMTKVIPAVEGAQVRPAQWRAIVGFSMGGYGAANLGLRHADMFSQIVSLAGYFHVDDPAGMFNGEAKVEAQNTPDSMVSKAANHHVLLLEDADESDPLISGEAQEFGERLHDCACNVDLNWHIEPGGHDFDFVSGVFPKVISFLDRNF